MAQGIEPVDGVRVMALESDVWIDVDVSSYVPSGAVGVVLEMYQPVGYTAQWGVRKKGSSDDIRKSILNNVHTWCAIGIDENRVFQAWKDGAYPHMWLWGYIPAGAGNFLTNAIDKSLSGTGSWIDIDISGDTGDDQAKVAIFLVTSTGGTYHFGLRENGSTDNRPREISGGTIMGAMMPVDGNEKLQGYIEDTGVEFYLVGWINAGYAESWPNALDYSFPEADGGGETVLTDIAEGSKGAFLHSFPPSGFWLIKHLIMKPGYPESHYENLHYHCYLWCGVDENKTLVQRISSTYRDLYLLGYVKEGIIARKPEAFII